MPAQSAGTGRTPAKADGVPPSATAGEPAPDLAGRPAGSPSLAQRLPAALFATTSALMSALPRRWTIPAAAGSGALLHGLLRGRRRVAEDNLRAALGTELNALTPQISGQSFAHDLAHLVGVDAASPLVLGRQFHGQRATVLADHALDAFDTG